MTLNNPAKRSGKLPFLNGLRALAFLLVLVHHIPQPAGMPQIMQTLKAFGWVGVELFFVISAYLFFTIFDREYAKTGSISVKNFFIRRFLRIFPLMVAFPLVIEYFYGTFERGAVLQLAGIFLAAENFMIWVRGYNVAIPYTPHLWTLAFELQVYLVIPLLYRAYRKMEPRNFALLLLFISLYCTAMRVLFALSLSPSSPIIWVTPFLRPDSVLLGIALSVYKPRWNWLFSLAAFAVALTAFVWLGPLGRSSEGNILTYPVASIMVAALVDVAHRCRAFNDALSIKPLDYLGEISYGLYVFHFWAMTVTIQYMFEKGWLPGEDKPLQWWISAFGGIMLVTISVSALSKWAAEDRVDRLKSRFSATARPLPLH